MRYTHVRVLTSQVMAAGGTHVKDAADKVLGDGSVGALLGFVNEGQHTARTQDYRDLATQAKQTGGPEPDDDARTGCAAHHRPEHHVPADRGTSLIACGAAGIMIARRVRA